MRGDEMCVESIDEWNTLLETLSRLDYRPYYTQFDASDSVGFHALLWSIGHPDIKVVTHCHAVQNAIESLCPGFPFSFSSF
jgi:hypothetical protein